jgi:hypothetical protein
MQNISGPCSPISSSVRRPKPAATGSGARYQREVHGLMTLSRGALLRAFITRGRAACNAHCF